MVQSLLRYREDIFSNYTRFLNNELQGQYRKQAIVSPQRSFADVGQ
jgi:hypothetical protein